MRRAALALMTGAFLLTLAGCGAQEQSLEDLRARLEGAGEVSVSAVVTAATDSRYSEYNLECRADGGGYALTVLAPEEVAGVTARMDSETGVLEYDGLALSFETPGEVSPITALPTLCEALKAGYETISWSEGDDTYISLEVTDELSVTVRLNAQGVPIWAELTVDGESAAACDITQFTISEAT